MKLFPENISELDPNLRWGVALRLQMLEELASDPDAFEAGSPDLEESWRRAWQAVARRDRKAEDDALVGRTKAELWEWWQGFSERRLFTELYRRVARREAKLGPVDSRRRPSRDDGLRLAAAMLVDLPEVPPLDLEWEYEVEAQAVATQLLPPFGRPFRPALRYHIDRCEISRVHFDALNLIYEGLSNQGKVIPGVLIQWRQQVADGCLRRPTIGPIPRHRPANPEQIKRDIQIQFVIEVLGRVGIPPQGTPISGCGIVAEVLTPKLSEDTIRRIWKECTWRTSYLPIMRKYSKAIAIRTGLHPIKA